MAVDMFLKLADIPGESIDATHKDEIQVLAWSWGISQSGSMHAGPGGGAGKANVQDLSFTKYMDKSSPNLAFHCCKGTHFGNALLTVRKAGGNPLEYYKLEITEVLITSISTGGSGGEDRLTENITLNFAKWKVTYQPQDAKGAKLGGEVIQQYDIPANA